MRAAVVAVLLGACTTGGGGARPDAAIAADASPCGPPFVQASGMAQDLASGRAFAGVVASASSCPSITQTTAADGQFSLGVALHAAAYVRFDAPGHLSWILGTVAFDGDFPGLSALMVPTAQQAAVFPEWTPGQGILFLEVRPAFNISGCTTKDGVSFAVTGHPEAVVVYRDAAGAAAPTLTATSSKGQAVIKGIAGDVEVTVVAAKAGCKARFAYASGAVNIVSAPLRAGAVTYQQLLYDP
jgi:hypothetical protein